MRIVNFGQTAALRCLTFVTAPVAVLPPLRLCLLVVSVAILVSAAALRVQPRVPYLGGAYVTNIVSTTAFGVTPRQGTLPVVDKVLGALVAVMMVLS